uniref:Endonuclease/exonuclease/phosphatase domain-containing protein n=1 Tax=Astyanax mexicanus TaxID=7994 RepID=A0A3B1K264_ASTMX
MSRFNFMSWNVRGLNKPSVDIALLQETNLKIADVRRGQNRHYRITASSSAPNKTKGVSILIKRNLNLNILKSGADTKGRFCFIKYIFSVYAPNYQDASFYDSPKQVVLRHPDCIFLMGGGGTITVWWIIAWI